MGRDGSEGGNLEFTSKTKCGKKKLIKLKGKMKVHKPKLLSFNSSWDLSTLSGPNEPNDKVETLAQKNPV